MRQQRRERNVVTFGNNRWAKFKYLVNFKPEVVVVVVVVVVIIIIIIIILSELKFHQSSRQASVGMMAKGLMV